VVTEVESGGVALEDLTSEQRERLRAAVRILLDYVLEQVSLKDEEDETQAEADGVPSPEPQPVPLRLEP
jgi:hypothetical protein